MVVEDGGPVRRQRYMLVDSARHVLVGEVSALKLSASNLVSPYVCVKVSGTLKRLEDLSEAIRSF